jgi:hypothetical protein
MVVSRWWVWKCLRASFMAVAQFRRGLRAPRLRGWHGLGAVQGALGPSLGDSAVK